MTDINLHKEIEKINKSYVEHVNADVVSFGKIDRRFDELESDRNARHNEIKDMFRPIAEHMERVEPMIKGYEDNLIFVNKLKSKGQIIMYAAGVVITISGAWFIFKTWIVSLIIKP